ncbi:unnamed protein product [Tuber aestivum]|uniref:Uncharacterized protein n=1 Tax=Tuber aestivum TaxID=59557 RepID=A0A292PMH2_9PEZI|nr:unnamed protein product [Tuber aestivum]
MTPWFFASPAVGSATSSWAPKRGHRRGDKYANTEKCGIDSGRVSKVESNPAKSKHLETARINILELEIGFVNLRSELYFGDGRIPHVDFTGLGLQDLADRLIRTPLPPKETFADDPLRVLHLICFASRLVFTIVPKAKAAMKLPEIKACNFSSQTQIITRNN